MTAPIKIKKSSDEWKEIERWCGDKLKEYRLKLENEGIPLESVPALRAKISALKSLLNSTVEDSENVRT